MAHATVGYYFNGSPENGGEGLLINMQRCQAFKVAQKLTDWRLNVKEET